MCHENFCYLWTTFEPYDLQHSTYVCMPAIYANSILCASEMAKHLHTECLRTCTFVCTQEHAVRLRATAYSHLCMCMIRAVCRVSLRETQSLATQQKRLSPSSTTALHLTPRSLLMTLPETEVTHCLHVCVCINVCRRRLDVLVHVSVCACGVHDKDVAPKTVRLADGGMAKGLK